MRSIDRQPSYIVIGVGHEWAVMDCRTCLEVSGTRRASCSEAHAELDRMLGTEHGHVDVSPLD